MMQFFPVLTDSSYLKLDDTDTSIKTLVDNFPDMKGHYDVPLDQIKRLNIPAFNFGCHGKDAHKWTERVHKMCIRDRVNMVLMRYFTEHLDQFDGNLIFMTNPVEENQHTGIIESLNVLEELKAKYGLTYKMAMNTDFISPAFPGDTAHYFHAGAVGKILPCFYIIGKPTHSGQGFEGFSASMVAAEITRNIDCLLYTSPRSS